MLNEQAVDWLNKHKNQIPAEDIVFEEDKIKDSFWALSNGWWPIPKPVSDMEKFDEIYEQVKFNSIISNPNNWDEILVRKDLYENWVLPNAVLLFSKMWFDHVKWRSCIKTGIPFPLFTNEDKFFARDNGISIEETTAGRAMITHIVAKTSYALKLYLRGSWFVKNNVIKYPGPYIIKSLRNELSRIVGKDLGYKQKSVLICPDCCAFSTNKSILVEHGRGIYSCPRCDDKLKTLTGSEIEDKIINISCVCPSDSCASKVVTINHSNVSTVALKELIESHLFFKNIDKFKLPPESMMDVNFHCPCCKIDFTPRNALELKSGFKGMSGYFTGLPKMLIWEKKEMAILDKDFLNKDSTKTGRSDSFKNSLVSSVSVFDSDFIVKQKICLLADDLYIKMSKLNKNIISGLTSWCFYKSAIEWMNVHYRDAYQYFFSSKSGERDMSELELAKYPGQSRKRTTSVFRGQEASIHQSFFKIWLKVLEDNISDFNKFGIKEVSDFKWFSYPSKITNSKNENSFNKFISGKRNDFVEIPKFILQKHGPVSTFISEVDFRNKITNRVEFDGEPKPRLVKIHSIVDLAGVDRMNDVFIYDWQTLKVKKDSKLKKGDVVKVTALMMPGHPTHAPIQRILRLRSLILRDFVIRIKNEEETGMIDSTYWNVWKLQVEKAKKGDNI